MSCTHSPGIYREDRKIHILWMGKKNNPQNQSTDSALYFQSFSWAQAANRLLYLVFSEDSIQDTFLEWFITAEKHKTSVFKTSKDRWKDINVLLYDNMLWSTTKSCSLTIWLASCQWEAEDIACTPVSASLGNTINMDLGASGDVDKTVKLFRDFQVPFYMHAIQTAKQMWFFCFLVCFCLFVFL